MKCAGAKLALRVAIAMLVTAVVSGAEFVQLEARTARHINQQQQQHQIQTPLDTIDDRRPIWNIAHMVNSIKELDYRLGKGANAVETDITFNATGIPLFTYHGPPCDCLRHCYQTEDFGDFLRYVRDAASASNRLDDAINYSNVAANLTLVLLDLKLENLSPQAKVNAGNALAKHLIDDYFFEPKNNIDQERQLANHKLRLVVSINHISDIELVLNLLHTLDFTNTSELILPRIGFDVGMNDDIELIESMWRRFNRNQQPINIWQGDGWTNCISPFYNLERLSIAISKRDSIRQRGYMQKVYQWTIDLHDRLRDAFRLGVDAIMTNHPERVVALLEEHDISQSARLATSNDNPFERFKKPQTNLYYANGLIESSRKQRSSDNSAQPMITTGFIRSIIDIFNSWVAYIREIPLFSLPTTSRFLRLRRRNSTDSMTVSSTIMSETTQKPTTVRKARRTSSTLASTSTSTTMKPSSRDSGGNSNTKSEDNQEDKEDSEAKDKETNEENNDSKSTTRDDEVSTTKSTTVSDTSAKNSTSQETLVLQDGPKWYTSLVTSVLLGILHNAYPPPPPPSSE